MNTPTVPLAVSLASPTADASLNADFGNWTVALSGVATSDVIEYDVQYDNNNYWTATSTSYCDNSVGFIDSATSTFAASTTTATLPKGHNFVPPNNLGYSYPILTDGEANHIFYKACAVDYTTMEQAVATGTFNYYYGSAPYATGGVTGTIAFAYPTGTDAVAPFSQYALVANNGAFGITSPTYYVTVVSTLPDGTTKQTANFALGGNGVLSDSFQVSNPFVAWDFGDATSTLITAKATLSLFGGPVLDTKTITYRMMTPLYRDTNGATVNPNGTSTVTINAPEVINGQLTGNATTTANTNSLGSFASSTLIGCIPAADWTDIGGGLYYAACKTWQALFIAPPQAMDGLRASFVNLESVPPFVWFFGLNTSLENAAASTTAAAAWVYESAPMGISGATSTFTLFQASYLQDPFLKSAMNAWFNIVLEVGVLLCVIGLFMIFMPR